MRKQWHGIIILMLTLNLPAHCADKKEFLADATIVAATGADFYFTNQLYHHGFRPEESNPIARPFVGTLGGRIAYFAAESATKIAIAHLLHKHHRKLELFERSWAVGDSVYGAVTSAKGYKSREYRP
jgi:hypothetical protein